MTALLDERLGADAPSTRNVSSLLERVAEVTRRLGATTEAAAPEASEPQAGGAAPVQASAGPAASGAAPAAPGVLRSREAALRELDRVAEFFRRTEPHSPLAFTLEDAVRRGRMTLHELLAEVLPDEDTRNAMLLRLGIRPVGQG